MPALREAQPADAEQIASVLQLSRRQAMPWLPVLHTPDEDVAFFGSLVAEQRAWVVVEEVRVIAFAIAAQGWLNHLYVDPDRQGRGWGTLLLTTTKAAFPDGVQLWVFEANAAARRFYAAHDFVEAELTDGSGNEERTPDIRMEWSPR